MRASAFIFAALLATSPAQAEDDEEAPKKPAIDPSVVPGPPVLYTARPHPARDAGYCSTRATVCVHAATPQEHAAALVVLGAFERAWATLTGAMELPPPDVDPDTKSFDVFLADAADPLLEGEIAKTLLEARDMRGNYDRARSFTLVDSRVRPGCQLDALAARSLARAILFRAAPATDEATARAQTTLLAQLVAPCSAALATDAAAVFQSRPDRSMCDPFADEAPHAPEDPPAPPTRAAILHGDGAAIVWSRLDWAFARAPGGLVLATWALSPTITPAGAVRWQHEPDTFDVLRASFKDRLTTGSTIDDLFLDLAVARAFMGAAEDGLHAPETRALGDSARIAPDWDIAWPKQPRRLVPRRPVAPSGASYLLVRRAGADPKASLRVEIVWEEHALFRWTVVKLDGAGRELGRVGIPAKQRATEANMTLVDLEGVDHLMIVGANVGDPAYSFDPDEAVWEPHGWMVTLAEEH